MAEISFKKLILTLVFTTITAVFSVFAESGLEFSITEWNTGELEAGIVTEKTVEITNKSGTAAEVELISTCSCVSIAPDFLEIAPEKTASFTIYFDSSDDSGEFEKLIIVRTNLPELPKGFFVVTGSVAGSGDGVSIADSEAAIEPETSAVELPVYFYTAGCRSCNKFISESEIPITLRDITGAENYELMSQLLDDYGVRLDAVPVLISVNGVFQGEDAIRREYSRLVSGDLSVEQMAVSAGERRSASASEGITLVAVFAAGLLDGVNPCAFTTLIFLLSALSVAGRSRKETLLIGLFFTLAVFVTYYLIGLGFFRVIRIAGSFSVISTIIRWLLLAVLIVFAGLSFYDYSVIKRGKSKDIILQLPDYMKKKIHSSIRTYSKSAAIAGSSILMGMLVSVFELGCTGQIYFPTITYMIQTGNAHEGWGLLAVYNIAFIIPLAAVFAVVYIGVTSRKITSLFQTHLGTVKLLTGIMFIGFALMILFF